MFNTFNMGVGMAVIVSPETTADQAARQSDPAGQTAAKTALCAWVEMSSGSELRA